MRPEPESEQDRRCPEGDRVLAHIDIEINHRCNLACRHCSAQAVGGPCPEELSVAEINGVLREAKAMGLRKVGLTGGEPLCDVEKLAEIADFCIKHLGVTLHMHTNGTQITQELVDNDGCLSLFEDISVTFLGGDVQTHDHMTATSGSFDRAFEGARLLAAEESPLTCFYVPTHGTCDSFAQLTARLRDIGVKCVRAMALAPSGRARPIYGETAPTRDEMRGFEDSLLRLGDELGVQVQAGYCTRLSMPGLSILNGHESCTSGVNRVHINSRGDVFPCTAASGVNELRLGNLRENGFRLADIWEHSPLLGRIRALHRGSLEACRTCGRSPKCRAGCLVNAVGTMQDATIRVCPLTNEGQAAG